MKYEVEAYPQLWKFYETHCDEIHLRHGLRHLKFQAGMIFSHSLKLYVIVVVAQ